MSADAYGIKGRLKINPVSSASDARGEIRTDSSGNLYIHDGSEERKIPNDAQLADFDDAPAGDVVGTTDTQTLTNKTIDGDNNTISNLAHGAEVDDPTSGVHGVTGDVVGTSDTQTLTNKTLTSPVFNTGVSGTAVLDEDDMNSDSDTQLATQQSIKAYADTKIASSTVDSKGDLLAATAADTVTRLAVGTDNQVLIADSGEATGLRWGAAPSIKAVDEYSSNQTLTNTNDVVLVDANSAAVTVTLFAAAGNAGKVLSIKKIDSSTNAVTIDANASETIDGQTTYELTSENDSVEIACDGTEWHVTNSSISTYLSASLASGAEATTSAIDTYVDSSTLQLTLTPGTWDLGYSVPVRFNLKTNSGCHINTAIRDGSNNVIDNSLSHVRLENAQNIIFQLSAQVPVTVTSSTTYKVSLRCTLATALAEAQIEAEDILGALTNPDASCFIWARRVK